MKYSKAEKLENFNRPKNCSSCGKMMKPALHGRWMYERFSITRLAKLYQDKCEWCGFQFEYWA